jgi:hypothetical protein
LRTPRQGNFDNFLTPKSLENPPPGRMSKYEISGTKSGARRGGSQNDTARFFRSPLQSSGKLT